MEYINYLTTPSGRYCLVKDISNGDYLILVKYLQSLNISKFYECLDTIVKKSVPNLDEFDIVEKCYLYIAMCMYSVKAAITVTNKLLGNQDIPLALVLNNIERCYTRDFVVLYELKKGVVLKFGYPKKFLYEGDIPTIDFFSGLIGYNDVILSLLQKDTLRKKLDTKTLMFIDDYLREKCACNCDIFNGVQMNKFELNIFGLGIITNTVGFFRFPLDAFYKVMYTTIKHIKMSYSDFLKISHLEASIMLKYAVLLSSKINLESKNGNVNLSAIDLD